jgi:aryl-alcohol dehydrogenase-like predicted oxidoreductase
MKYRRLGRTQLEVSEISLGTVEIGLDYGIGPDGLAHRPPEAEAARLLNRALDLGVNFIDTARAYGESEAIIGRALRGRRNDFVICSKALSHADETPGGLPEKVAESVEASLRALATDVIEIMMIHSAPMEVLVRGEMIGILEDLRSEGKFRWIGASVYGEEAALAAIRSGRFDCLQVAYSALDRRQEPTVWPEAVSNEVGIVARSVLLKGVLTQRYHYLPAHLFGLQTAAGELETLAKSIGIGLAELAYRYVLSQVPPHTALVGASAIDELEAAVRFGEAGPLPVHIVERIREIEVANEADLNPATWGVG